MSENIVINKEGEYVVENIDILHNNINNFIKELISNNKIA